MRSHRRPLITGVVLVATALAVFLASKDPGFSPAPAPVRISTPPVRAPVVAPAASVSAPADAPSTPAKIEPPAPPSKDVAWKTEWCRLSALPAAPGRDAALAAALKRLSATAPNAAEERLLALHPVDRILVVTAALAEAANRSSDEAVREAIRFCDEDPAYSLDYGRSLISTLSKTGDYPAALGFTLAEESNGWLGENGHKWLSSLFTTWAASAAPVQAAEAAQSLPAGLRGEALQIVAAAWASTDPAAAASFAVQLPASTDRTQMLAVTFQHWADADPAAATAWVGQRKESPTPETVARPP